MGMRSGEKREEKETGERGEEGEEEGGRELADLERKGERGGNEELGEERGKGNRRERGRRRKGGIDIAKVIFSYATLSLVLLCDVTVHYKVVCGV